jgi:hypothetical protein
MCCGSETFHYGSGSCFQKVPVSDPTFFLTKYDFKGLKMAFQNINVKEYLNLVYKIVKIMKLPLFLMVFVNVHMDMEPDPEPSSNGSGSGKSSGSLRIRIWIHNTD